MQHCVSHHFWPEGTLLPGILYTYSALLLVAQQGRHMICLQIRQLWPHRCNLNATSMSMAAAGHTSWAHFS